MGWVCAGVLAAVVAFLIHRLPAIERAGFRMGRRSLMPFFMGPARDLLVERSNSDPDPLMRAAARELLAELP
jgi:uncharacterized membrane protein YccF (DUF307 family)